MANYALLIGIDQYYAESGLRPLVTATSVARRMAGWLEAQRWVAPEQIRLLCAPLDGAADTPTATRAAIAQALHDLQQSGVHAGPDDRLYVLFAGYALGHFGDQLLLLPQDANSDAYDEHALPWIDLKRWLRGSGFLTQFCFLATCRAESPDRAGTLLDARLPLEQGRSIPPTVDQYTFVSIQDNGTAIGNEACVLFSDLLHAGLEGAATASVDYATSAYVIRNEALAAYLEQALPRDSGGHIRCIIEGVPHTNPIVARLGPAVFTEMYVTIQPPEAAAHATVTIFTPDSATVLEERKGSPLQFRLVQQSAYVMVVRAPDYEEQVHYIDDRVPSYVVHLQELDAGVLGHGVDPMAELLVQPEEAVLPVRLFNRYGYPITLPPKKPRGYVVRIPPDRYRGQLVAPEWNIEREIEAPSGQTTILTLPFDPAPVPRALDRFLMALDHGQHVKIRPATNQAALIVLAQDMPAPISIASVAPHYQEAINPAHLPPDVIALLRQRYLGPAEPLWLTFTNADGAQHQVLIPLLPSYTTIVGLDGAGGGFPIIEILLTAAPLLRRNIAAQKRVLWAQRFFRAERRSFIPMLVEGLDTEPLALILAGYSALLNDDTERALAYARRLQTLVPTLADGRLLQAVVSADQPATAIASDQLPILLTGLSHAVHHQAIQAIHPLAYKVLQRAVLSQIWLVVRGSAIHHSAAEAVQQTMPASHAAPHAASVRAPTPIAPVDIVLITATDVETKAVLAQFSQTLQQPFSRFYIEDKTYFYLGRVNGATTVLVQSEMGAVNVGGSLQTTATSIQALRPQSIIMVGIAFGIDPVRQRIGDILIARQILDYELQRVGTDSNGELQIRSRGDRPTCSPRLLDRFRSGAIDWNGAHLHFGLMLSGAKLIDQQDFRDQLRRLEPEAIGGEMEGMGLYAAAQHAKIDWILIKAICDYADGQKSLDKENRQRIAAKNAAQFVLHVIGQGGFATNLAGQSLPMALNEPKDRIPDNLTHPSRFALQRVLDHYFNASELQTLCFELGIDHEQLAGANKSDKVRELITYAERHGRIGELELRCRQLRPHANW